MKLVPCHFRFGDYFFYPGQCPGPAWTTRDNSKAGLSGGEWSEGGGGGQGGRAEDGRVSGGIKGWHRPLR